MNEELIISVANILEEWNPLGEQASSISELDGYHTEAIDILSSTRILKQPVRKALATVLSQAFGLSLDEAQLNHSMKSYTMLILLLVSREWFT